MPYGRQRCCFSGTRRLSLPVLLFAAWSVTAIAQDSEPAKSAVPTATRQAEVRKLLDETFELSKASTPAKKQQAAQKLMEMAADPATAGDELYVVLVTALPLLREAGDLPTYLTAIGRLIESFQLDAEAERTKHVTDFMTACKSSTTLEPLLNEVVALVGRAAQENRYRAANELLDAADKQAKKITATKLSKSLTEARGTLREREQAFITQTQAQKILEGKPDDPKANFAVGLWLAVYESDWEQALPKLALGSDAKWKAAATAEPKSPSEVEGQLVAADAWWEVVQSATGEAKLAAQRRAHEWYKHHEPNAKSPLVKARVTKRLEELAMVMKSPDVLVGRSASRGTASGNSADGQATNKTSLFILEAKYGTRDTWVDLTERAKAASQSGRLVMVVSFGLMGRDPAFGVSKRLTLRYRLDGNEYEQWYGENTTVQLEGRPNTSTAPTEKLVIHEALYGGGINGEVPWANVTDRARAKVQDNRLRISVSEIAQGIADSGVVGPKSLFVRYSLHGEELTCGIYHQDTVKLGVEPSAKQKPEAVSKKRSKDNSGLIILDAKYGANDTWIDLTERVGAAAKSGRLFLVVGTGPLVGKDPTPFVGKRFRLRYRLGGKTYEQWWGDNSIVYLDGDLQRPSDSNDKLEILEAQFGSGILGEKTWVNVTDQLKSQIMSDQISVPVRNVTQNVAEPISGPKVLFVRYSFKGEIRTTCTDDQGNLTLGK